MGSSGCGVLRWEQCGASGGTSDQTRWQYTRHLKRNWQHAGSGCELPGYGHSDWPRVAADGTTPLPNLPVTLSITQPDNRGTLSTDADSQGRFFFPGVPAGSSLWLLKPRYGRYCGWEWEVTRDGEQVTVDLRLIRLAH